TGRSHGAQPPVPLHEQWVRRAGLFTVQRHAPEPLTAQRAQVGRVADDRQPGGGSLVGAPRGLRRDEPSIVSGSLDLGPAVVAAGLDEIQLVRALLAELAGPQPAVRVE